MPDLFTIFNISAIFIGMAAVIYTIRLYLKFRFKYLLTYTFNLSLFNIVIILFLPVNYLFGSFEIDFQESPTQQFILFLFFISINIIKYLWGYTFIMKIYQLINKNVPKKLNYIFIIISSSTLAMFSYFYYRMLNFEYFGMPRTISYHISDQVLIGVLAASVYLIYYSKKNFTGIKLKSAIRYFMPFSLIISWVYLTALLNYFLNISELLRFNISLVYLSYNIIPLLFLKKFARDFRVDEEALSSRMQNHSDLFAKYKITKREREIVELICNGKSNQQIADELFISLATVKDHVHKVFQKTSVKSRIQLSNLFR